jgi:hypothetical protein
MFYLSSVVTVLGATFDNQSPFDTLNIILNFDLFCYTIYLLLCLNIYLPFLSDLYYYILLPSCAGPSGRAV